MDYTNWIATENFIMECDDLMIPAEESVHQMKKAYKVGMKEIKALKKKIQEADGDPLLMEDCYEQGIMILQDMKSDIKSFKPSGIDKTLSFVGNLLPIVSYLAASFGLDHIFKKYFIYNGDAFQQLTQIISRAIAEDLAGRAASKATKAVTKPLRNRIDVKKALLKTIDMELNAMKKALSDIKGLYKSEEWTN